MPFFQKSTLTVDAGTVSTNTAGLFGGGIYNRATLNVLNGSTIGGGYFDNIFGFNPYTGQRVHPFTGEESASEMAVAPRPATSVAAAATRPNVKYPM